MYFKMMDWEVTKYLEDNTSLEIDGEIAKFEDKEIKLKYWVGSNVIQNVGELVKFVGLNHVKIMKFIKGENPGKNTKKFFKKEGKQNG